MAASTPSSKSKPHALAVPLPYQGHIHPLIQLSKKLVSVGFMVTFANTQANHERIKGFSKQTDSKEERGGGAAGQERGGGGIHFVSLEEGFPAEFETAFGVIAEAFKPEMKASVAHLLVCLCKEEPPVSLLIFDFRLHFIQDIAAESGIPSLSFWTQNAANLASNLVQAQGFQLPPGYAFTRD